MTIDETIKHARNIAKEQRYYAQFEKGMMRGVCINTAENNEQIAKWLEELKEARKGFNENRKAGYKHGYSDGYVKAIDEFVNTLMPRLTDAIYQKDVESMTNLINDVARELKEGGMGED